MGWAISVILLHVCCRLILKWQIVIYIWKVMYSQPSICRISDFPDKSWRLTTVAKIMFTQVWKLKRSPQTYIFLYPAVVKQNPGRKTKVRPCIKFWPRLMSRTPVAWPNTQRSLLLLSRAVEATLWSYICMLQYEWRVWIRNLSSYNSFDQPESWTRKMVMLPSQWSDRSSERSSSSDTHHSRCSSRLILESRSGCRHLGGEDKDGVLVWQRDIVNPWIPGLFSIMKTLF